MKKNKLEEILKLSGTYIKEITEKEKNLSIDVDMSFVRKENKKNWNAKIIFAFCVIFITVLAIISFLFLEKDLYLKSSNFGGQVFYKVKNKIFPFTKNIFIKDGYEIITKDNGFLIINKDKNKNNLKIVIKGSSQVKILDYKLFSKFGFNIKKGKMFFSLRSAKKHFINFKVGKYDFVLYGSKIFFNVKDMNNFKIKFLEGILDIKTNNKIVIKGINKKTDIIVKNGLFKINEIQGGPFISFSPIYIEIGNNEPFWELSEQYFCLHNYDKKIFLINNKNFNLIKINLPERSKSYPFINDGKVYLGTYAKTLLIFDTSLNLINKIKLNDSIFYSAPQKYNDKIIFIDVNGVLYCLDKNYKIEKKIRLGFKVWSKFVIKNDILFIGGLDGNFYAFSLLEKRIKWKRNLGYKILNSEPFIIDEVIVIKNSKRNIFALDITSGEVLWKIDNDINFIRSDGKNLYLSSKKGEIYLVNLNTGGVETKYSFNKKIKNFFVKDGVLFFLSMKGILYKFNFSKKKLQKIKSNVKHVFFQYELDFFYLVTTNNLLEKIPLKEYIF